MVMNKKKGYFITDYDIIQSGKEENRSFGLRCSGGYLGYYS